MGIHMVNHAFLADIYSAADWKTKTNVISLNNNWLQMQKWVNGREKKKGMRSNVYVLYTLYEGIKGNFLKKIV